MRGARRGSGNAPNLENVDWSSLKQLIPFMTEFKGRIGLALLCLVGAKLASVGLPFILKQIVDHLNGDLNASASALVIVPIALLVAYGVVRS